MTNLDALNSVIGGNYPLDPNVFEKGLEDNGLSAADTYSGTSLKSIDYAAMDIILSLLLQPDIEEGGYKVSQSDKNALITVRNTLRTKYGLPMDNLGIASINRARVW